MPTFHRPASDAAEAQQALHRAGARHPRHQRPLSHDRQTPGTITTGQGTWTGFGAISRDCPVRPAHKRLRGHQKWKPTPRSPSAAAPRQEHPRDRHTAGRPDPTLLPPVLDADPACSPPHGGAPRRTRPGVSGREGPGCFSQGRRRPAASGRASRSCAQAVMMTRTRRSACSGPRTLAAASPGVPLASLKACSMSDLAR